MCGRAEVHPDAHQDPANGRCTLAVYGPQRQPDVCSWETAGMHRTALDALFAGMVAAAVTFAVTPLSARLARRLGAVDQPRDRGLSDRPTPLLGGVAIFAGVAVSMSLWLLGGHKEWQAILWGAAPIRLVGAIIGRGWFSGGARGCSRGWGLASHSRPPRLWSSSPVRWWRCCRLC